MPHHVGLSDGWLGKFQTTIAVLPEYLRKLILKPRAFGPIEQRRIDEGFTLEGLERKASLLAALVRKQSETKREEKLQWRKLANAVSRSTAIVATAGQESDRQNDQPAKLEGAGQLDRVPRKNRSSLTVGRRWNDMMMADSWELDNPATKPEQ